MHKHIKYIPVKINGHCRSNCRSMSSLRLCILHEHATHQNRIYYYRALLTARNFSARPLRNVSI